MFGCARFKVGSGEGGKPRSTPFRNNRNIRLLRLLRLCDEGGKGRTESMTASMTEDRGLNRSRRTDWRTEWRAALRTEWRTEWMTEDRTHEFRWRVAAPGGRWREEKKDNSKGNRRPDDWLGHQSPKLALSLFPTANRQPLTADSHPLASR